MVLTLYSNVRYGLLPCTSLTDCFGVTEVESVYCAVCTESLYKTDTFRLSRVKFNDTVLLGGVYFSLRLSRKCPPLGMQTSITMEHKIVLLYYFLSTGK